MIYYCTRCNKQTAKTDLLAKKVIYVTLGSGGRTIRSRVREWLCPECCNADTDWVQPSRDTSMFMQRSA